MSNKISIIAVGIAILAVLLAGVALVGVNNQSATTTLGASTPGTRFPHGVTIGLPTNSPTNIADVKVVTCSAGIIGNNTVTASSTKAFDCAVTGIISTDIVFFSSASTTQTSNGFVITGASASSTAGFITLLVSNLTGANNVVPYGIASGTTAFLIVKTQ